MQFQHAMIKARAALLQALLGYSGTTKYKAIGESDRMTLRFVKPARD